MNLLLIVFLSFVLIFVEPIIERCFLQGVLGNDQIFLSIFVVRLMQVLRWLSMFLVEVHKILFILIFKCITLSIYL